MAQGNNLTQNILIEGDIRSQHDIHNNFYWKYIDRNKSTTCRLCTNNNHQLSNFRSYQL